MSLELHVAIDNARDQLELLLPAYAAGALTEAELPHALGILLRQLGTCRMLLDGVAAPLFIAQMQAAGVYLFRLPSLTAEEKVTSLAASWWDAVAGGYWEAARDIARHSRMTPNPSREHEDDFLYVAFLMQRYFLAPAPSDSSALAAHSMAQERRLARWRSVLGDADDPKLTLCEALHAGQAEPFREALLEVGRERSATLERQHQLGRLLDEHALWAKPVWPQGLALLRLAEQDGLNIDFDCPGVPNLLRCDPPFQYEPEAWRTLDFQPVPR